MRKRYCHTSPAFLGALAFLLLSSVNRISSPGNHAGATEPEVEKMGDLLDEGLKPGDEPLETARRLYATIKVADAGPRLHHAWGLVCLKHAEDKEALEQFRLAAKSRKMLWPPAWEALIRAQVANQEYPAALEDLVRLAERLDEPESRQADESMRRSSAAWMGRMIAYLQQLLDPPQALPEPVVKYDARIVVILDDQLLAAYGEGKRQLLQYRGAVTGQHPQPPGLGKTEPKTQQQRETERAARAEAIASEKNHKAQGVKGSRDEAFQRRLATFDVQLLNLANQYAECLKQANDAVTVISQALQPRDVPAARHKLEVANRRATSISDQINVVRQSRQQLLSSASPGQQPLVAKGGPVAKGNKRIAQIKRGPDRLADVARAKERIPVIPKLLSSYFPLDFEKEKNQIIASCAHH
ncbi:MAG: hypothetical protein WCJ35_08500 [Planctomycetota bacterium]